jgi:hypothetical protein
MYFVISFTNLYFEENEIEIRKKFVDLNINQFIIKRLDKLPDQTIIVYVGDWTDFWNIMQFYLFDTNIDAIGDLIVAVEENEYKSMQDFAYIEKIVSTGFSNIIKDEGLVYLVMDLSKYDQYEKVLKFIISYSDRFYDAEDSNEEYEEYEEDEEEDNNNNNNDLKERNIES